MTQAGYRSGLSDSKSMSLDGDFLLRMPGEEGEKKDMERTMFKKLRIQSPKC